MPKIQPHTSFAIKLKDTMRNQGMSVDDLVRADGALCSGTIRRWLDGSRFPSAYGLAALCRVWRLTPEALLAGVDVPARDLLVPHVRRLLGGQDG